MPVKKTLSSVQRTLRSLRNQGTITDVCERFNPYGGPINPMTGKRVGIRQDLFNFIDLIALKPEGIIAVQGCGSGFSDHQKKIIENEYAPEWLQSGRCSNCGHQVGRIELWGWRKLLKNRGGKQKVWVPRVEEITLEDYGKGR